MIATSARGWLTMLHSVARNHRPAARDRRATAPRSPRHPHATAGPPRRHHRDIRARLAHHAPFCRNPPGAGRRGVFPPTSPRAGPWLVRLSPVELYAAYGSNMDPAQMALRCPHSPQRGTGWLEGWRLTFGGADIGWEGAMAT